MWVYIHIYIHACVHSSNAMGGSRLCQERKATQETPKKERYTNRLLNDME